ncbi:hypothetical protein C6P61_06305 [Malikia spinosa]|uniref:Uncharacterized protein n=1 Tax=Malikia spinosa TaxID=86180 RepID=A0A2S9KFN6_9BURK|nr:hypothetical protein [Malikia spinosa]PRD69252.1 hypothetical protein C6P61_06305 [Malikia spinosa]
MMERATQKRKPAGDGNPTAGQQTNNTQAAIVPGCIAQGKADALALGRTRFTPRQTRALEMLMPGHWITRETLDRGAGASNSPDLIQQLRGKLGRDGIEMELFDATDRDGKPTRPGRYRLTQQGRERLAQINVTTDQGSAAA